MARDVFISYRTEDKEAANRICAALERENVSCWIAPRDIPIGREWPTAIVEGLQSAKSFVLVLSSNSKNEHQISREAELADRQGLPIITLRIEDVQPPPGLLYFLGNIQWLDAFGGQFDSAVARLTEIVRQSAMDPAEKIGVHAPAATDVAPHPPTDPPLANQSQASPSLSGILCGRWEVQISTPFGGLSGRLAVELFPNGTFSGQIMTPVGPSTINGQWQVTPSGQLVAQGVQTLGWSTSPYMAMIQFNQVSPGMLSGMSAAGEQVLWRRMG